MLHKSTKNLVAFRLWNKAAPPDPLAILHPPYGPGIPPRAISIPLLMPPVPSTLWKLKRYCAEGNTTKNKWENGQRDAATLWGQGGGRVGGRRGFARWMGHNVDCALETLCSTSQLHVGWNCLLSTIAVVNNKGVSTL
mmetsp:Transcript_56766/g.101246  ORF Transcript_56766/g.101246 Transcript_56766/m.101246 type:complete len:138 (-) Transcript_56766:3047-3460(-)